MSSEMLYDYEIVHSCTTTGLHRCGLEDGRRGNLIRFFPGQIFLFV